MTDRETIEKEINEIQAALDTVDDEAISSFERFEAEEEIKRLQKLLNQSK